MANTPIDSLTATWNNAGTAFNAIKMAVTNTASAAASNLINLLVGGVSQFKVDKNGNLTAAGTVTCSGGRVVGAKDEMSGMVLVPVGQNYIVCLYVPYACTLTRTTFNCTAGSCVVTVAYSGGAIATTHTMVANVLNSVVRSTSIAAGHVLYFSLASVSGCLNLSYTFEVTRT